MINLFRKCIETSFQIKHACPICRAPVIRRAIWKNQKLQSIVDAYSVYSRGEKIKQSQSMKDDKNCDAKEVNHFNHQTIKKRKR